MLKIDRRITEWRIVDGEVVALHLGRQVYFTVNPTGTELWQLLAEGAAEPELASTLVHVYGLSESTARADVAAFLAVLRDRGLLEEGSG
jgi:Coenzyme PQQ synthesis protein D (PqqD)